MNKSYDNQNSFGKTYGEHRAFLEFTDNQHFEIYSHAKSKGLDFVETLCATGCLSLLNLFEPDYLKVASRDLTNLPLLSAMAQSKIPMILSTGMAGRNELDSALNTILVHHSKVSILHCVSEYPTRPENVNLQTITFLKEYYSDFSIGYSDHTVGIATPVAAVAIGAEIIEKHITLDRRMKGTDQSGSLGPDGVNRMVRDIRLVDLSMGKNEMFISPGAAAASEKLERSIASNKRLEVGQVIRESDVHLLSPGDGIKWTEREKIIDKTVARPIEKDEIIYLKDIQS